jgi:hypothetical protein
VLINKVFEDDKKAEYAEVRKPVLEALHGFKAECLRL